MALSDDSDEEPAQKGKGKAKGKKHLTEEEQEAKLAAKGAAKAAEWLASGFTFKQVGSRRALGLRVCLELVLHAGAASPAYLSRRTCHSCFVLCNNQKLL